MQVFLISLIAFVAAFAAMAIGCVRGRPPEARECGGCPARCGPEEGGARWLP